MLGLSEKSMKTCDKIAIATIAISLTALFLSTWSLYYTGQEVSILREKHEKIDNWLILTYEELMERGNNCLEEGDYWEAIKHYDKALEIESDDLYALRKKGYAFINLGMDNESVKVDGYEDAEKILYFHSYYTNQCTNTSQYYFNRGFECFLKAKNLNPEDPEIGFYYSVLCLYLPNGPDPIESFNETINTIKNLSPYEKEKYPVKYIRSCAWYGMGMAYRERNEKVKAEECFDKAIKLKERMIAQSPIPTHL